jgi:hypothetical protein
MLQMISLSFKEAVYITAYLLWHVLNGTSVMSQILSLGNKSQHEHLSLSKFHIKFEFHTGKAISPCNLKCQTSLGI